MILQFKKRVLFLLLFIISLMSYGQTSTQILNGYYNAATNYGFSCNVQVQITKQISGSKVVFKSKLLSVRIADNKGWYDNSTHKYISCDIIGNYCVIFPQFLDVKTEYGNLPFDSYSFSYVGEERVIYESTVAIFKSVVGIDAPTFKIAAISQTIITHKRDAPIWDKLPRLRESGNIKSGTSSSNSNPLSSTNSSTNSNPLPNKTTTTKLNIDPNTGLMTNPLPYSSTTSSNSKTLQTMQAATDALNGLAQLMAPTPEQMERRRLEEEKKAQLNQISNDLIGKYVAELQDYLKSNSKTYEAAKNGNSKARQIIIDKVYSATTSYYYRLKLNSKEDDKNIYNIYEKNKGYLENIIGGKVLIYKWLNEINIEKSQSNNIEDVKKAIKYFSNNVIFGPTQRLDGNEVESNMKNAILAIKNGIRLGESKFDIKNFIAVDTWKDKGKFNKKLKTAGIEIDDPKILDYCLFVVEANISKNLPETELSKSILKIICDYITNAYVFNLKECQTGTFSAYSTCNGYSDKIQEYKNLSKQFK